jgi:predicted CXXCH cytochrome family protein
MKSLLSGLTGLLLLAWSTSYALDPPHDNSNNINCINCHTPHGAPGGSITREAGNPNLCMTCHTPGGLATNRPFNDVDQARPGVSGFSHRWDSGPSGHVERQPGNTSTGSLRSGGVFSGRIENRYTITITSSGDAGIATFDWSDDRGNSGSGSAGSDVPFDSGLLLDFADGASSPSFIAGDSWVLEVRTDLRLPDFTDPFERPMAQRLAGLTGLGGGVFDTTYAKVVCSVCHDQHSQEHQPFDPGAPPFLGDGTGEGRFFQRRDNDFNQMCVVCHAARNVASSTLGSHPVGVPIPGGEFQPPAALNLDPNAEVACMTCHAPHYADSGGANAGAGDGYLLNQGIGDLCLECHTLADQAAGSHFDSATGALWPGGQYGSSFPAHSAEKQGFCINCHWPHGWADDDQPVGDYPRLWVEQYDVAADGSDPDDAEDLCYTCHDGSPAQTDIRGDFAKGANGAEIFHHPVMDSEQTAGRSVECTSCHNPHRARANNRLAGVDGVDLAGNPVGPGTANPRDVVQQELCFKCHGDSYNSARSLTSNKRLDFNTSAANSGYHPVTQAGRGQSANLAGQLLGGLTTTSTISCTDCHNSDATAGTPGPVTDSVALTQGPHGSTQATILRANFDKDYQAEGAWNNNRAALCFLCHDQAGVLGRRLEDGASTNFYQFEGRDNLHEYHLISLDSTHSCLSCHFDIHSNRTASNTQYRWIIGGVASTSTTPPPNVKTHLVSFAPDVQPTNGLPLPRWEINTDTGVRTCTVLCHGGEMVNEPYQPPGGDETSHTF